MKDGDRRRMEIDCLGAVDDCCLHASFLRRCVDYLSGNSVIRGRTKDGTSCFVSISIYDTLKLRNSGLGCIPSCKCVAIMKPRIVNPGTGMIGKGMICRNAD